MNTHSPSAITNEMLYELIKDFKTDINRRFEQADRQSNERFAQVDKRFDEMFDLIREERSKREKNENKLEKIYESRNRVSVNFTRLWAVASFFIAILSSVVTLTIDRMFVK
jgi:hypothetical protein